MSCSTVSTSVPDVCISIVSWNTRELVGHCLTALGARPSSNHDDCWPLIDGLSCHVVVVDNASSDGTVEMIRERFPWVTVVANRENVGFARATNQALRASTARYALLLNPDTESRPGALERLVQFMDVHPHVGAAGPRLLNTDGSLQLSVYREPTLRRELWRLLHLDALKSYASYRPGDWPQDQPRQVDVVQGACLIVPRAALDQVGLLDEDYFIYSEEVDLCSRLRKRGWQVFWVPNAAVVHHGAQSTRQVAAAMFLRLYQGKVLFFRKQRGHRAALLYKLILGFVSLLRLLVLPVAFLTRPLALARHIRLARYYVRLLQALPRL